MAIIESKDGFKYDGEVKNAKPYGNGKLYAPNGMLKMEGVFGIKGLTEGKVYYPDGNLEFEGKFEINKGYGPNYPIEGTIYDKDGQVLYSGKIHITRSGLGYPFLNDLYGMTVQDYAMHVFPYMWEDDRKS